MRQKAVCVLVMLWAIWSSSPAVAADDDYMWFGELSGEYIQGFLQDQTFTWDVTELTDGAWRYTYTFDHEVSHIVVEVTPGAGEDDFYDLAGNFVNSEVGEFGYQGRSNPGMPENLYGIKFEFDDMSDIYFSFSSHREPVWGDFYAKQARNGTWNSGFTEMDVDVQEGHILRPNGVATPEPASIITMALGLGMVALKKRLIR